MSEFVDAIEGAVGLIAGGIVFLLFGSVLGQVDLINMSTWGVFYIVVGFVVLATLLIAAIAAFIGGEL